MEWIVRCLFSPHIPNISTLAWVYTYQSAGSPRKKQKTPPDHDAPSEATLSEVQTRFLGTLLGEAATLDTLQRSRIWFIAYLEFKTREAWSSLFRDVLVLANPLTDKPCSQELSAAFAMFETIVRESSGRKSLALTDLVDALYNNTELKETDEERSLANQLAFASFGWLSMPSAIPLLFDR